jgi:hypothetical protein
VDFESRRVIPGEVGGPWNATISAASIDLSDVRAVGDSGVVSEPSVALDWNGELGPSPLSFEDPPPGIYSQLAASIDDYSLVGTVEIDGVPVDFEIVDVPPPDVALTVNLQGLPVEAGKETRVDVVFDFEKLIEAVSWNDVVPDGNGVRRVDGSNSQIDSIRDELDDMFEDDE